MTSDDEWTGPGLGLLGPARSALAVALKRAGRLSVADAVEALGQSKTSTRAHLLEMEKQGIIARVESAPGTPGRPPLVYELTPRGERLFPNRERQVLMELMGFLEGEGEGELVVRFLESMWGPRLEAYERVLAQTPGEADDLETRLEALERLLTMDGFMPTVRRQGQRVEVQACNCPFAGVVDASKIPCRLEARLVSHAVGAPIASSSYMFEGSPTCTFAFDLGAPEGEGE